MIDELERLRETRPDVPPPTPEARGRALRVLKAVLHDATPSAPATRRARPRWRLPSFGVAMSVLSCVGAVVVAIGAALLLHHGARHVAAATGTGAPRGEIVASGGAVLAGTRTSENVVIDPARLAVPLSATSALHPPAADRQELARLERLLGVTTDPGQCEIAERHVTVELSLFACTIAEQLARASDDNVTVLTSIGPARRFALNAHRHAFPGVSLTARTVRTEPSRSVAAQVLGTVGPHGGQSGLEYQYDGALRAGDRLRTTLDIRLQRAGMRSLAQSIRRNDGAGGAFVAMSPTNGDVYAMGSLGRDDPQLNRAIESPGQVGSLFTPITAAAGLQSRVVKAGQTFDDTGSFTINGVTLYNSGHAANGVINVVKALQLSDDVFFYHLGALLNVDPVVHPNGGALQQWARTFGIGRTTGIDLPAEAAGTLPTPRLNAALYREEVACENATGLYKGHPKHPASEGGCGIANNPGWTIGDNINAAVGQGDDQVTPIQLAVVYGALANGGTVVTPHVGQDLETAGGTVLRTLQPAARRHLDLGATDLATIRLGLRAAASQPGGGSSDVMASFGEPVSGMAGTAQFLSNGTESDYAWYAGYVPASATRTPIVVVVTVERGGFGDVAAAPVARQIFSQWFDGMPGRYRAGASTTL